MPIRAAPGPPPSTRRTSCGCSAATFSSQDQLLTLALGGGLDAKLFAYRARGRRAHRLARRQRRHRAQRSSSSAASGCCGEGDEYIHCTHLSDEAWRLIKDTGGQVSLSPPIEMAMGHGMPAIQDALDHGIRPSLSSDVDVTMAQDPFTVMRSAFTLQRLQVLQRARKKRAEPAAAPHRAATCSNSPPSRARAAAARPQGRHAHARQGGRHRHAARPTASTSGRSTTCRAWW